MNSMICRGIRGATTVTTNSKEAIIEATTEMLNELVSENGFNQEDIAGVWFTTTPDLDAEFPAVAARNLGFTNTALECLVEMNVPGSLARCIRVLMHVNSDKQQKEIRHIYLKNAKSLRADLIDDDSE